MSCNWTASSNVDWVTVTSNSTGTGSKTVTYSVAANESTSSRTGTLTVAGKTFTVKQTGKPCTYSISPISQSFTWAGGTGSINVTSLSGCPWTATSNVSWITITSGDTGNGNGVVTYSVASKTGSLSRTGTLKVAGKTFTVTQAGVQSGAAIKINPGSIGFGSVSTGATATKTFTVSNNGTVDLVISNASTTASSSTNFTYSSTCTTLKPGGSCTVTVTFSPGSAGYKTGYLDINSNDPNRSRVRVSLNGTGN